MRDWVVTYDISQDEDRARVASLLEQHGPRVLYSVFEIAADDDLLALLKRRAERVMRPPDKILFLPHCTRCTRSGRGSAIEDFGPGVVLA